MGSVQISTGDILRGAVRGRHRARQKGRGRHEARRSGLDDLIMGIMEKRLQEPDCAKGFLLDGFPRTIPQAEALKLLLAKLGIKLDMVVSIEVPRDVILDRLSTRRTCSNGKCQAIYNVKSNPPKKEGICDKCGSPVVQREDEPRRPSAIASRPITRKTAPLIGLL